MVKRLESLTEKGEFSPHASSISGHSLKETLGASWHQQVGIISWQGFCHKPYEVTMEPQFRIQLLLPTCLSLSTDHTQAHHRVIKVQHKTCLLGGQRTRAPSVLTLSWESRIAPNIKCWCWAAKDAGAPGLQRRGIQSGPVTSLDSSELLCDKSFIEV